MTTSNESLDLTLIERAGLSQSEAARLLGVSRVSVHHWVSGRRYPHRMVQRRVALFLSLLKDAIGAGELPGALATIPKNQTDEGFVDAGEETT